MTSSSDYGTAPVSAPALAPARAPQRLQLLPKKCIPHFLKSDRLELDNTVLRDFHFRKVTMMMLMLMLRIVMRRSRSRSVMNR
jgi:hypothetical protein